MVLGVVGKIGSGKSYACKYICNKYFGIYLQTDVIAKKILGELKFSVTDIKKDDKYIKDNIHPKVWQYVREIISKTKNSFEQDLLFVIETALPDENFFEICDKSIYIKTTKNIDFIRLNRKIDEKMMYELLELQKGYDTEYEKTDFCIENNDSKIHLQKQIDKILYDLKI